MTGASIEGAPVVSDRFSGLFGVECVGRLRGKFGGDRSVGYSEMGIVDRIDVIAIGYGGRHLDFGCFGGEVDRSEERRVGKECRL